MQNVAHARNGYQKTSIKPQVVQKLLNTYKRKFKIGQSLVLSTSGFKHRKTKNNTPTTHTKYKIGWG